MLPGDRPHGLGEFAMKYVYWLANCGGISDRKKTALLDFFGSCRAVYEAKKADILSSGLLNPGQADSLLRSRNSWDPDVRYERFLDFNMKIAAIDSEEYPESLRNISNPPFLLYFRGRLPERDEKIIAVVGARRASEYGKAMAEEIAADLAMAGYSIVSGMAVGIDSAAQNSALYAGGRSYAFLGGGVDVVYPAGNHKLYQEIIQNGAVISEFPPQTAPRANHFPARNRLISGLSRRTLVIEAKSKSGALITADFALEQGRDVYALPGRITDPMSEGTNRLIAQGAGIITSSAQLIADFAQLGDDVCLMPRKSKVPELNLEKRELMVYSCFDFYAKGIEEVAAESGLGISDLMSVIVRLSMRGLIKEVFKNRYVRC